MKWVPVKNYESRYEVSNTGLVRSRKTGLLRKPQSNHGYEIILLYVGKKPKGFLVHRLVATAFIPNPGERSQVNHIDGNKRNNTVGNLEWVTIQENWEHAKKHGLSPRGEKNAKAKLSEYQVKRMRLLKEVTPAIICKALGKMFGVSASAANYAANGTNWSYL